MKKILSFLMAIIMVISFTGCVNFLENNCLPAFRYELVGEKIGYVEYIEGAGYSVKIEGQLKNITKMEFSCVNITFAVYDKDNNQIETAEDHIHYLQSGRVWAFQATMDNFTEKEPVHYKLVNVEIW